MQLLSFSPITPQTSDQGFRIWVIGLKLPTSAGLPGTLEQLCTVCISKEAEINGKLSVHVVNRSIFLGTGVNKM